MTLLWVALIALLGSLLQSSTGFGFAIVSMALWPFFIPFKSAAVVTVIASFLMVLYISVKLRRHINFRLMIFPVVASTLTGIAGVFILMVSAESLLRRVLGAALFLMAVYSSFSSKKIRIKSTPAKGLLAGAVSGFMGGLLNIGGPPMVAYYISVCDDKMEYNATLQCFFMLSSFSILGTHLAMGNFSGNIMKDCIAATIGILIGTVAGMHLFKKLPLRWIKKAVFLLMSVFGLFLLIFG
jgi:uncharacterized membrane protein YfcA